MTPEALFEIAGAVSEIPSGFVQPGSCRLILEGPWVGVAICAVISVHHIDSYMEAKYIVTAHIHLGGKHWKIPVPIHLLVADSETQLVFYWTVADDLQRIVGSSQKSNFGVSFSVEPEDGNLQVTKFGVRFINKEYISHLKRHEDFMIQVQHHINRKIYEKRLVTWKEDTHMDHHIHKLVDFIFDHGRQQGSLDAIYQITKGLLEINQGSLGMSDYHVIHLGASVLYNDFVQSVKVTNDGWLSVKLALEQILVKSRAGNYSYKEMLEQLDDLEAAKIVGFSDKYIKMLESMFRLTFRVQYDRSHFMAEENQNMLVIITGILCMVAAYMGYFELLEAMRQTNLKSLFLHLI
ncbi:hypothetical protein Hanom_Chr05g00440751 [Helianthus anomalus]